MSDDYSRFEPPTEESPEWQDADSSYEGEEAVENYEDDYYDSSDAFLTDDDDLYYDDGSKGSSLLGNRLVLVLAVVAVIVILLLVLRACGVFGAAGSKDATPTVKPTVTLPAGQAATGDGLAPTPTPAPPTATPLPPTPIPATIRPGVNVVVANTGEDGMSFRTGPGTKYVRIEVLKDGAVLKVVGGPEDADGFTWWRLQDQAGTIGWGVEDFLEPTGG